MTLRPAADSVRVVPRDGQRRVTPTVGDVMTQIRKTFGMGDRPDLREAWYQRVEGTLFSHGPKPLSILRRLAKKATGKRSADRYFVNTVTREFENHGWW